MPMDRVKYDVVEGPDQLRLKLEELFKQAKSSQAGLTLFSNKSASDHYLLYKIGEQRSFIKVDMSREPLQFWYCDTDHRPATPSVIKTIDSFVASKSKKSIQLNVFFHDLYAKQDREPTLRATEGKVDVRAPLGDQAEKFNRALDRLTAEGRVSAAEERKGPRI